MAWLCPRMLVCGSRVSGSLAAIFRTFFCASATGASTRPTAASIDSSSREIENRMERDIGPSPFAERTTSERDQSPEDMREDFEDRASRMAATIYEPRSRDKGCRVALRRGPAGRAAVRRRAQLSSARPTHQRRAAVERRQHLVGLRRRQIEDEAGDAGVAIALEKLSVLRHAEDRDRQRRRVASGLDGQLAE